MIAGLSRGLKKEVSSGCVALTKSQRSQVDAQAPLGVGTTRSLERVLAAMGRLDGAPIEFEVADDVPQGGVLCALPALLVGGLLRLRYRSSAGFVPGQYRNSSECPRQSRESGICGVCGSRFGLTFGRRADFKCLFAEWRHFVYELLRKMVLDDIRGRRP